jgi:lipid-A-disaccharide synthase
MHVFISAGEPSGDLHGASLARELRKLYPQAQLVGFGGDRMTAAGVRLLYPLCQLAVMWFLRVLVNLHRFWTILQQADRYFRDHRPDVVVLIDYPGFHWWLARCAKARGIPVIYFVPPQIWAWAGWRVNKMRKYVDHVLCTLPFEQAWYAARNVPNAEYIGHPYFDELPQQQLDANFLAQERSKEGRRIALLPGSRNQEVTRNLPTLLQTAQRVYRDRPDTRFLVACYNEMQADRVNAELANYPDLAACVTVFARRTPEIIAAAETCVAVSGSVGLELLYRGKPSCIVYRLGKLDLLIGNFFRQCKYISIVNLLADAEVFPEFLTDRNPAPQVAEHLLRWLDEPLAVTNVQIQLAVLRDRVGAPGACTRAAEKIAALCVPAGIRRVA